MTLVRNTVCLCFLLISSLVVKAQSADEIIGKYVDFIGGAKQWAKVQSIVTKGTYDYGGMQFPFEAYSKAPNFYRYKVSSNGKYFEQAFDGKQGWKIDVFKGETNKTILTGNEAKAMANEADVALENPFINYQQKGYEAILDGEARVDSVDCFKIKFISNEHDTATCFFSKKDFSLVEKQAVSKNAELDKSVLNTYYSDYKKVGGITLPYKMISKIGDQTILTVLITNVELNVPVADSSFKP